MKCNLLVFVLFLVSSCSCNTRRKLVWETLDEADETTYVVEDDLFENHIDDCSDNNTDVKVYSPINTDYLQSFEIPKINKPNSVVLQRTSYSTSYNNKTKNANWVAWHLTSEHTDGPYKRDGIPYVVDEDIEGPRQELEDWYGHDLQIDHGHMCPAGDNKWSKTAMEETFLLTNMCPQNRELNRGDWEKLESRCRGWAKHYGEVWITCGPIFYSDAYETIGENKVGVPDAFFKVVLRMGKKPAALGFIYPNEGIHHPMEHYVMTVDEVEGKTGIDFFHNLPDSIENIVESTIDFKHW